MRSYQNLDFCQRHISYDLQTIDAKIYDHKVVHGMELDKTIIITIVYGVMQDHATGPETPIKCRISIITLKFMTNITHFNVQINIFCS